MNMKSKLLAMTEGLQLPPETPPAVPAVNATPTPAATKDDGTAPRTKFPPVAPGPVARTGPGQMLQFRGQMLAAEGDPEAEADFMRGMRMVLYAESPHYKH